jgi:hypothetical protein
MDLSFFPLTLEAIDQAAAESLCLFIGADERPLTGLAGLADWRLQGRLSRLLRSGALTGEAGEAVLTPPGSRLGFRKLFLFGLGPAGQNEDALSQRLADGLRKIAEAGVQEAALHLPAKLTAEAGIRALLAVTGEKLGPSRAMVFTSDPQKLMAALSQAASRGQAQVERRVVKVPGPGGKQQAQQKAPASPALPKVSPLPFARDLPPPLITPPSPIPKAALPIASALAHQRPTDEGAIAQAISAPPPPKVDPAAADLVARAIDAATPEAPPAAPAVSAAAAGADDVPVAPALPPSVPPPAAQAALPALQPPATSQPGKRPAPPPPPPPPVAPKRPPPTPSQRYVPPEPTQNVFDRSKRKKH